MFHMKPQKKVELKCDPCEHFKVGETGEARAGYCRLHHEEFRNGYEAEHFNWVMCQGATRGSWRRLKEINRSNDDQT